MKENQTVTKDEAVEFAAKHEIEFVEISTLTGENVERDVLIQMTKRIKINYDQKQEKQPTQQTTANKNVTCAIT